MSWILTSQAHAFDPLHPDPQRIDLFDIAHALSNLCRFTGHTREFYSVAQHSVLVAEIVPAEHRLTALLHDATEAYLCDVATPVKAALINYCEIEERLWRSVAARFDLPQAIPRCVKQADLVALATERRDLMPHHPGPWECLAGVLPVDDRIVPLLPGDARAQFLDAYARCAGAQDGINSGRLRGANP